MQLTEWVRLFKNAPPEAQDGMILGIANGSTVAVQDLVRIDPEYVIVKGRLGGTTDAGMIFCLPYDQLTFFVFNKPLTDEQYSQTFGGEIKIKRESNLEDQDDRPALQEDEEIQPEEELPTEPEPAAAEPATKVSPDLRARLGLKAGRNRPPLK
jgi:hypothetical protein